MSAVESLSVLAGQLQLVPLATLLPRQWEQAVVVHVSQWILIREQAGQVSAVESL